MSNEELVAGIQESREMLTSLRASEAARKPALIHWRNRKPRLVTMRLVDWLKLYRTERKPATKKEKHSPIG